MEIEEGRKAPRPGLHRRLYDWVLHWAYTPYGSPALALLSFAESSFFPVPPDVLLIPLTLGRRQRWVFFAGLCTITSVLGGLLGYYIGHVLWSEIPAIPVFCYTWIPGFTPEVFRNIQESYQEWGFWIVFTAGFTFIPFKLFTIAGGVCAVNLPLFTVAALVGRGGRFFLVAFLVHRYGEKAQNFIDRRFNLVCLAGALLLVGGFLLVKYLL